MMNEHKATFTIHSKESAPKASRPVLEHVEKAFGFIPNMTAVLAESPLALTAYATVNGLVDEKASLNAVEQQVAILSISKANGCDYCVAAHAKVAAMLNAPEDVVQALREGRDPEDAKYAAVSRTARALVEKRGWLDADEQQAFFDAGYEKAHLLDLVALVALKTISNYTNHLAHTPLDAQFAG